MIQLHKIENVRFNKSVCKREKKIRRDGKKVWESTSTKVFHSMDLYFSQTFISTSDMTTAVEILNKM